MTKLIIKKKYYILIVANPFVFIFATFVSSTTPVPRIFKKALFIAVYPQRYTAFFLQGKDNAEREKSLLNLLLSSGSLHFHDRDASRADHKRHQRILSSLSPRASFPKEIFDHQVLLAIKTYAFFLSNFHPSIRLA